MACCSAQREIELIDSDKDVEFTQRIPQLVDIDDTPAYRLTLLDWSKQFEASERSSARKLANCNNSKSDLYQILGLFFVFQGVILTAVAQASALKCTPWHWPLVLALSLMASIFTIGASIQKLKEIVASRKEYNLERALYTSLNESIEDLKEKGLAFNLERNQPQLGAGYKKGYKKKERTGSGTCNLSHFCSVWVISYAGAVLLLVCTFSAVMACAVPIILCRPFLT